MHLRHLLIGLALLISAPSVAKEAPKQAPDVQTADPAPAPQWHLDDIEFMTRDGGRWIASNADYQSENEPFEIYAMEWKKGYANSMTGRLYGIRDGKETGDFCRFRQYWPPGKGQAILEQFGFGGAVGIGPVTHDGAISVIEQTFYPPKGQANIVGHKSRNDKATDSHLTDSFTIVDGEWRPNRSYEWRRMPTEKEDG